MKYRLILIILIFNIWQSKAQIQDENYIHLLDSNKLWVEAMLMEFGEYLIDEDWTGDTITHNDTLYYEVFTGNTEPDYFREDTIEKKVYNSGSILGGPDGLLYDFSMNVGDSISYIADKYMKLELIQMKDIFGIPRKVYYFKRTWEPILDTVKWIEGIGSLAGILHPDKAASGFWTWMDPYELNCYYHNEELKYQSDLAIQYGCYFESLNIYEVSQRKILLFPNPVKREFTIVYKDHISEFNCSVALYDILGKCSFQKDLHTREERINISELSSGVYIVNLIVNSKILYRNKLIKI